MKEPFKYMLILIGIIIIIILYFYRVIQSAINIAAIKRSPVNQEKPCKIK